MLIIPPLTSGTSKIRGTQLEVLSNTSNACSRMGSLRNGGKLFEDLLSSGRLGVCQSCEDPEHYQITVKKSVGFPLPILNLR